MEPPVAGQTTGGGERDGPVGRTTIINHQASEIISPPMIVVQGLPGRLRKFRRKENWPMTTNPRSRPQSSNDAAQIQRPTIFRGDLRNLPPVLAPLVAKPNWVLWKLILKNGKWDKPPYQPSGRLASSRNPATWNTYDIVIAAYKRSGFDGIGFVINGEIAAFDIDNCRSLETGLLHDWASRLVAQADSYTEITPSGTGLRIIGTGQGGKVHIKKTVDDCCDPPLKCEIYRKPQGRYITINNNPLPAAPLRLADLDAVIDAKVQELGNDNDESEEGEEGDGDSDDSELPQSVTALLHFPDGGQGVPHGKYGSRSELTFACIVVALRAGVSDKAITNAFLDEAYTQCAIFEHCRSQTGSTRVYVTRQIEQAREEIKRGLDAEVTKVNKSHALVLAGNKAAVMKFEKLEGREQFRLLQVGAMRQWYSNQHVSVGKKSMSLADFWLTHKNRRQYQGIEFAPIRAREGYYNLWRGFAVEPREGDCSKFLKHLEDNVAQGDPYNYKWIVGWFAQIVQEVHVKVGTSLALRGGQGVGKTKVGEVFGSLFGSHYELVSDPRYITGQFNSHMAQLVLLHADEAFWAGDKRSEGKLKDMVTGLKHRLEFKGVDPILVNNYIRLLVTGNQDWLVPAGFHERRFAVFDVGEGKIQNSDYFAAIDYEMDHGGREALLYYLLNFDLSQVNLRVIPRTTALLEQIIESATPEQAWWFDVLKRGELPWGINEPNTCPKKTLFRRYIQHANIQGARRRAVEVKIGMFLKRYVGPNLQTKRKDFRIYHRNGRRLLEHNGWVYVFPSLRDCRERFVKEMGQDAMTWDEPAADWTHETEEVEDENPPF
jgi:hypothetical protein